MKALGLILSDNKIFNQAFNETFGLIGIATQVSFIKVKVIVTKNRNSVSAQ